MNILCLPLFVFTVSTVALHFLNKTRSIIFNLLEEQSAIQKHKNEPAAIAEMKRPENLF